MIYIVTPSMGLIFSKTVESITNGREELASLVIATKFIQTHDLSIPDCFNVLVEKALADPNCQKILFIEEDMYLDVPAFVAISTSNHVISTLQYNDKNGSPHGIVHYNNLGEIIWCGLGATIVKREVFEKIKETGLPYFRTDTRYKITRKRSEGDRIIEEYEEIEPTEVYDEVAGGFVIRKPDNSYGGQDVDFFTRVRRLGYQINLISGHKAHHFQLMGLGEPHTNHGIHSITNV